MKLVNAQLIVLLRDFKYEALIRSFIKLEIIGFW